MSEAHEHEHEPITEEVDALLVVAEEEIVLQRASAPMPVPARQLVPVVQAAAVAATGFVAGAAVVGLVSRRHNRALAKGAGPSRRRLVGRRREDRVQALQIVSTRSLLVDIHRLDSGEQR